MSVPEYTPRSSQMVRILSSDFITFWSPSMLERDQWITLLLVIDFDWIVRREVKRKDTFSHEWLTWPARRRHEARQQMPCGKRWHFSSYSSVWHHWPGKKGWACARRRLREETEGGVTGSEIKRNVKVGFMSNQWTYTTKSMSYYQNLPTRLNIKTHLYNRNNNHLITIKWSFLLLLIYELF